MHPYKKIFLITLVITTSLALASCKVEVDKQEYTLEYNSKTYEGKYSGAMKNNLPQGEGKFVCGNEGDNNYFIYDGTWDSGEMKGNGTLTTNNYTVHFPKTNNNDAVDRTGAYNGVVIDGVANGEGSFSAKNDEGISFTYTGQWKDGLYNGQGKVVYDSKDKFKLDGNFENGEFKPSPAELIKMIGTLPSICAYTVSDEVFKHISENENVFVNHDTSGIEDLMKPDFSLEQFKKEHKVENPYYIKLNDLMVVNVTQGSGDEMYGYDFTEMLCQDSSIRPYRLYYLGHSDKLVEDNYFNAVVLPLDYSTYETVDGGKEWALVGWIVEIE